MIVFSLCVPCASSLLRRALCPPCAVLVLVRSLCAPYAAVCSHGEDHLQATDPSPSIHVPDVLSFYDQRVLIGDKAVFPRHQSLELVVIFSCMPLSSQCVRHVCTMCVPCAILVWEPIHDKKRDAYSYMCLSLSLPASL
jgi:hypothetical protein